MRGRLIPLVIFGLAALSACTATGSFPAPREYLDEKTAATVTVVAEPLVFARERRELAAHSQDYVTLTAASVNRSGAIDYFLFAYFWSTLDRRNRPGGSDFQAADAIALAADDRLIRPPLMGHSAQEAGVGTAVHAPPHHRWALNVYRTDVATLRFLVEARHIAVVTPSPEGPITYEVWDDERRSLRGLVDRLEGRN